MKTNHQRGFKEKRSKQKNRCYAQRFSEFADKDGNTFGSVECSWRGNGRRDAKQFAKSRNRFHENAVTKKLAKEIDHEIT